MSVRMLGTASACRRAPMLARQRSAASWPCNTTPLRQLAISPTQPRLLTTSAVRRHADLPSGQTQPSATSTSTSKPQQQELARYQGPLARTFTRLKIFSLASLGLASVLTPVLLLAPGEISMAGRIGLVVTALATSGVSTCLIAWIGTPYVGTMRLLAGPPGNVADPTGVPCIELNTVSWRLQPRTTLVYDPTMIRPTSRPFATWELTNTPTPRVPTTADDKEAIMTRVVAETFDAKTGNSIGKWLVKYSGSTAQPQTIGKPTRYFNVHEELLGDDWQVLG